MKLHELKEMAIRGGNLSLQAELHSTQIETYLKDAEHIGDIDTFNVKRKNNEYGVYQCNELIATANLKVIPGKYSVVDNLWVKESFRGKKILAKLLWFFKSRENHTKILFGKVHTDDTVNLLKANGLSLFKKYWFNPISGETEVFDANTVDKFYKSPKQKWSLMLEHDGDDDFLNMPKFNTVEAGYISQAYDWQIDNHE